MMNKHAYVLKREPIPVGDGRMFTQAEEEGFADASYWMAPDLYSEMGEPETITITVENRDTLNEDT